MTEECLAARKAKEKLARHLESHCERIHVRYARAKSRLAAELAEMGLPGESIERILDLRGFEE
jgi:hypothetical protein